MLLQVTYNVKQCLKRDCQARGGMPGNPQGGNTTRCFFIHGGDVQEFAIQWGHLLSCLELIIPCLSFLSLKENKKTIPSKVFANRKPAALFSGPLFPYFLAGRFNGGVRLRRVNSKKIQPAIQLFR
jgi:hypothetical protein